MPERRTVRLIALLTTEQSNAVSDLIESIRSGSKPVLSLKEYLVTQRAYLESKEVLPEYLYYSLCYAFKLET